MSLCHKLAHTLGSVPSLWQGLVVSMQRRLGMSAELPPDVEHLETEPAPTEPAPVEAQPGYDAGAVSAATEAHNTAVTTAHETLKQRMENAYSIFASDLDRAYKEWQNVIQEIRQGAGLVSEVTGAIDGQAGDPTRAR